MKHSDLTKRVIDLMASGNTALLTQFAMAKTTEELDGVGYYVNFNILNKSNLSSINNTLPSIIGKDKDGKIVVGFVLFLKGGYIDCFEGYTFGNESWPDNDEDIVLEIAK